MPLFSLHRSYNSSTFYIQNFQPLTIFCGCTAQFVSDLVGTEVVVFLTHRLKYEVGGKGLQGISSHYLLHLVNSFSHCLSNTGMTFLHLSSGLMFHRSSRTRALLYPWTTKLQHDLNILSLGIYFHNFNRYIKPFHCLNSDATKHLRRGVN